MRRGAGKDVDLLMKWRPADGQGLKKAVWVEGTNVMPTFTAVPVKVQLSDSRNLSTGPASNERTRKNKHRLRKVAGPGQMEIQLKGKGPKKGNN